jgi:hypothetical protein
MYTGGTANTLNFATGGAERMRINSSGNVSIGTATSVAEMDIWGTGEVLAVRDSSATGQPIIGFYQQATQRALLRYTDSGDELSIQTKYGDIAFFTGTGGSTVRRGMISETGLFNLGINQPNEILTVQGVVSIEEGTGPSGNTSGYGKLYVDSADSALKFRNDSGTTYNLTAGSSEWTDGGTFLRPGDGAGENVAIGQTTDPGAKLKVYTNSSYGTSASAVIYNDENINSQSTIALEVNFGNGTSVGTDDKWIRFMRWTTEHGSISGNNDTGTVNYNTFTGSHVAHTPGDNVVDWKQGMIVRSVGHVTWRGVSGANYEIALTEKAMDPGAMGVFIDTEFPHVMGGYDQSRPLHYFNAVGDGTIRVTDQGGNFGIGDYICSSDIPGYGMRQPDDILHSYSVAKILESVDWEEIEIDPETGHKWKLVACTYHGG